MNPWWMVLADLRKTLLSALGVLILLALGFSATVVVSLFERALREAGAASAQDFDLVVGAPGSRLDLVLAAVYLRTDEVLPLLDAQIASDLAADPRVAAVSPLVLADHHQGSPIVGIGPDFPKLRPSMRLDEGRWPVAAFEVIAGAATGLNIGETFEGSHGVHAVPGVEAESHDTDYHVVGILAPTATPWDRALLTPFEGIWQLHEDEGEAEHEKDHRVSAILVKPRDFASAYALRAQYREGTTTAAFPGEVLAGLFGLFDEVKNALSLVSTLFQVLVFGAVLLSLLAGLPSKARWIGLLRALGAGRLYIFLTLWIQNALVFTLAVVAGAVIGWSGALGLAQTVASGTGLSLAVSWSEGEVVLLGVFWVAGLAGALVPAVAGYRTSVRQAVLGQ